MILGKAVEGGVLPFSDLRSRSGMKRRTDALPPLETDVVVGDQNQALGEDSDGYILLVVIRCFAAVPWK